MPRFAANLSFQFTDVPFLARFARAAAARFRGVEYLFPYAETPATLANALQAEGLSQVLFNLPPGDWEAGDRGLACLPHRQGEFAESVEQAIPYLLALDCQRVHCMAGLRPPGVDEALLTATYVANLRHAADRLAPFGVTVLIEPINSTLDMPAYWLDSVNHAFDLLAVVDRDNVRLQLDLYHVQVMQGDLTRTLRRALPVLGHVQIADHPGRHEPGTGEIHYPFLFAELDRLGYDGWVGCEYKPLADTESGLAWMNPNGNNV